MLLDKFNKRNLNPITTPIKARIRLNKTIDIANKNDLQLY